MATTGKKLPTYDMVPKRRVLKMPRPSHFCEGEKRNSAACLLDRGTPYERTACWLGLAVKAKNFAATV